MFESEFTGDWVFADGQWHPEIADPYDLDPSQVSSVVDVPIPGCPTGASLALMLAGVRDDIVTDAIVLDRIVGYERLAAWAAAGQARALAELSARRTADDPKRAPVRGGRGVPGAVLFPGRGRHQGQSGPGPRAAAARDVGRLGAEPWTPGEIEDRHTDAAKPAR